MFQSQLHVSNTNEIANRGTDIFTIFTLQSLIKNKNSKND